MIKVWLSVESWKRMLRLIYLLKKAKNYLNMSSPLNKKGETPKRSHLYDGIIT